MTVEDVVLQALSQVCNQPLAALDRQRTLRSYGLDSVRAFDLMCVLEDRYEMDIDDAVIPQLKTIGDVVRYIESRL